MNFKLKYFLLAISTIIIMDLGKSQNQYKNNLINKLSMKQNSCKNQQQTILFFIRSNKKNMNNNQLRKTVGTLNFLAYKKLEDRQAQRKRTQLKRKRALEMDQQSQNSDFFNVEHQEQKLVSQFLQLQQKVLAELAETLFCVDQINLTLKWLEKTQNQNKAKSLSVETAKIPRIMNTSQQLTNSTGKQFQMLNTPMPSKYKVNQLQSTGDTSKKDSAFRSVVQKSEHTVFEDEPQSQFKKRQKDINFQKQKLETQQARDKAFSKLVDSLWDKMSQIEPKRQYSRILTQQAIQDIMIEEIKQQQVENLKTLYTLQRKEKSSEVLNEKMIFSSTKQFFKVIKRNSRQDKKIMKILLQLKEQVDTLESRLVQNIESISKQNQYKIKWIEQIDERLRKSRVFSLQEKNMILQCSSPITRSQKPKRHLNRPTQPNQYFRSYSGIKYDLKNPDQYEKLRQKRQTYKLFRNQYKKSLRQKQKQLNLKVPKMLKTHKQQLINQNFLQLKRAFKSDEIDNKLQDLVRNQQQNKAQLKIYFCQYQMKFQYMKCQQELLQKVIRTQKQSQKQEENNIKALKQLAQEKLMKVKRVYALKVKNTKQNFIIIKNEHQKL